MQKTILVALGFALAVAQGASAALLTGATWTTNTTEDFSAYDPPPGGADPENISYLAKLLGQQTGGQRNCSYDPWANDGTLAQFRGLKEGGTNNVANLQQNSTTIVTRYSYRPMTSATGLDQYARYSFRVRSDMTTDSGYSASARASSGASNVYSSNGVPGWDVSNLKLRPHVQPSWDTGYTTADPEWIGPEVDISDHLWHTMDIVYDLLTGEAEWYKDGAVIGTLPNDLSLQAYFLGRPLDYFEFWQYNDGTIGTTAGNTTNAQAVMFDDLKTYGGVPIPEPATMILLGLGALPLLRRRRAS